MPSPLLLLLLTPPHSLCLFLFLFFLLITHSYIDICMWTLPPKPTTRQADGIFFLLAI
jgi:hypothetical protein